MTKDSETLGPKWDDGLVSIVLPVYNAVLHLEGVLESVVQQTHAAWEVVAVDDASTDSSVDLLNQWATREPRVRVLSHAARGGVAAARNSALRAAMGRYVAFLDADDIWVPRKLEIQLDVMRETGADLCFGAYRIMRSRGSRTRAKIPVPSTIDEGMLIRSNPIACSTCVIDRLGTGPVTFPAIGHEDYALWLSLLAGGENRAVGVPDTLAYHRIRVGSLAANKLRAASWQWNIYRSYLNLPLARSIHLMSTYAVRGVSKLLQSLLALPISGERHAPELRGREST